MHGGNRQRRGDRNTVGADGAVRQNKNVVVRQHRIGGVQADALHGIRQAVGAFAGRPGAIDGGGAEGAVHQLGDRADLFDIGVGQNRLGHFQPLVRARVAAQQVGARTDHRHQAHHQLFADRVDRRIGDLGEVLLEIIVEQLALLRQHGNRRVGAHRTQRVVAHRRHRLQEELQIFLGVAKGLLLIEQQRGIGRLGAMIFGQVRQVFQLELGRLQPVVIGLSVRELFLDLFVFYDAAFLEIDQQHLAGLQAPLALDLFLGDRDHARFRGQDDQIVIGDDVAGGAKSVAVQRGADLAAVGEGDGGGAVPRLHQRGMVFVESLALGIHHLVAGPGFRDQHHDGMRQRVTARDQKFERIVEAGGVGLAVRDQRPHLVEVRAQQFGLHRAAARIDPIDVAAHRVDFAVMGDIAIGMRQLPAREGVGRETLMHQRHRRHGQRVLQVAVEAAHIVRQQQALIDNRARRQRRHVELIDRRKLVLLGQRRQRVLRLLADGQQLAFEMIGIAGVRTGGDDRLADQRHAVQNGLAQSGGIGRHVAPAQQRLTFDLDEML